MKDSSIQIEDYHPSHLNQLIQLLSLNTPQYFALTEEADFIHYLKAEIEDYFSVKIHDEIVGCGGINYDLAHNLAIISWDIVHPEYQGKSLGKRLLEFRIDRIKLNYLIQKVVVRTSQHAYGFYEKAGFKLIHTKNDFWAKGFDLYHMELEIANINLSN